VVELDEDREVVVRRVQVRLGGLDQETLASIIRSFMGQSTRYVLTSPITSAISRLG